MAAPRPWTDADLARLHELHGQRKTLNAIAKVLGRSPAAVSRFCAKQDPPLTFDRSRTAAATSAKVADGKARRAALNLELLADAEKLRGQLWSKTMAFNFGGRDNTYNEHELDQPTFADQLKIMQSVGIAVDRSLKLDLHDSGAGTAQVVGLLQRTAAALGLTDDADTQPPTE